MKLLGPRHNYAFEAGWSRKVELDGTTYVVGVERGKRVRIAFKPRGQNKGWQWWGFVRSLEGRTLWEGRVGKSLGARGLLHRAGLIGDSNADGSSNLLRE